MTYHILGILWDFGLDLDNYDFLEPDLRKQSDQKTAIKSQIVLFIILNFKMHFQSK